MFYPSYTVCVYLYSKQFVFINFFEFLNNIWRKKKLYFFVGYPGAMPIIMPILSIPARFALSAWTKYCLTLFPRQHCNTNLGTAILNLNIHDNKHQARLVSVQLA